MKLWRRLLRPTLFAVLGASLLGQSAFAQFSSNTATRTTTGATGATGGSGYSAGATGASGNSGSMFGGGGGQGANSSGLGQTGQAGNAQGRQLNTQSQLGLNQTGFLGQGNSQQNFLGRNQRTQTQNNAQNRQNNNRGGQGNFGQNDFNNANGQGQQNQTDPKRAIRPSFKVAFDQPQPVATEIRSTLQPRFDSLSQSPSLRGVAYELNAEGVVVLTGSVDTPSQRRLAENVVKLEPGVKKVRNELTLNAPTEKL